MTPNGKGMAARNTVDVTISGRFPGANQGGDRSQGETAGAGSLHAAVINERPNISNPRNQGPSRSGSMIGNSTIPIAMMSQRNTGKMPGSM